MKNIGVFICHCGINIARTVDIGRVVKAIADVPGVVCAKDYPYMCSEPGQSLIKDSISEYNLDRVVVACCSPSLHKLTFMGVVAAVGMNRYCLEIANIREQCSWVHEDREEATRKAISLVKSAVAKVEKLEPLTEFDVGVTPEALVIGGGIAGIQAALDIANSGFKVHLVERDSSVGGHMAQLDKTFPTLDCSACILTPKMVDISRHENINLLTYSEVESIEGFVGNFKAKIKLKDRHVDTEKCTGCDQCSDNCLVRYIPQKREIHSIKEQLEKENLVLLDDTIKRYNNDESALVQILLDINAELNYLPENALKYVSEALDVPLSKVFQVATFYTAFSLKPRGEHIVKICMGTACHAKGAPRVLEEIERRFRIKSGETTPDLKYTLETVNCLGCCALGPVVTIDDNYYHVDPSDVQQLFDSFEKEESKI